jgi:pimeloyl-ACP methyl ester carboxylesterase
MFSMPDLPQLENLWFERPGVRLHAVAAGPKDGPLVILLHGFPEFWYSWRKQIGPLADAGVRVVVPDQRGYNISSKPPRIIDYTVGNLVADVVFVAGRLGHERFCLAGHDWGAAVAWMTALLIPERLHKLAILNVPHPAVFLRTVLTNPRQVLRSWYMAFFQLPGIPESFFSANDFEGGVKSLVGSSRPGTFSAEDLQRYREAWSNPGTVTAMINWYRAFFRTRPPLPEDKRVHVPTRILWGMQDMFLLPEMAEESAALCDSAKLTYFTNATHWLQHEEPEKVNAALIEHFRA